MQKKAIKAEYRKVSESFPKWLKYEITMLSEDGSTEKIPAYGKDLQDALARVVHDKRVELIQNKTKSIPWWIWAILFFSYISIISSWSLNNGNPLGIIVGLSLITAVVFGLGRMMDKRNIDTYFNKWRSQLNK